MELKLHFKLRRLSLFCPELASELQWSASANLSIYSTSFLCDASVRLKYKMLLVS